MRQSKFTETQIVSILKQAWCWWYRKYVPVDTMMEWLEWADRKARKGLWADMGAVSPWVYRKARREQDRPL